MQRGWQPGRVDIIVVRTCDWIVWLRVSDRSSCVSTIDVANTSGESLRLIFGIWYWRNTRSVNSIARNCRGVGVELCTNTWLVRLRLCSGYIFISFLLATSTLSSKFSSTFVTSLTFVIGFIAVKLLRESHSSSSVHISCNKSYFEAHKY